MSTLDGLVGDLTAIAALPAAPLIVIAAFVAGGFALVPVTALIAATVLVFGPLHGFFWALAGATASAGATYGVARMLGAGHVRRLAGVRMDRLRRHLAGRGLLAVVAVRLVPVAPFTVVNLAAGVSPIRPRDFLLGTALGLAPGIVATAMIADGLLVAIAQPGSAAVAMLAALVALIALAASLLRRRLRAAGATGA